MATDFENGVAPEAAMDPNFIYYAESARLQTEYILEKLKIILAEGGASMVDVAKVDVYITDQNDFYRFEQVWKKYFTTDPRARNIVPVSDLGVPGIRIGISLIAYVAGDGPPKRTIHTDAAPTPIVHDRKRFRPDIYCSFQARWQLIMKTEFRLKLESIQIFRISVRPLNDRCAIL
jgi:hypothetical protein